MRKCWLIICMPVLLLTLANPAGAITWLTGSTANVSWSSIVTPPGYRTAAYFVYYVDYSRRKQKDEYKQLVNADYTLETSLSFDIPKGRGILVGVQAVRINADGTVGDRSEIAWSDNPIYCLGEEDFALKNGSTTTGGGKGKNK